MKVDVFGTVMKMIPIYITSKASLTHMIDLAWFPRFITPTTEEVDLMTDSIHNSHNNTEISTQNIVELYINKNNQLYIIIKSPSDRQWSGAI